MFERHLKISPALLQKPEPVIDWPRSCLHTISPCTSSLSAKRNQSNHLFRSNRVADSPRFPAKTTQPTQRRVRQLHIPANRQLPCRCYAKFISRQVSIHRDRFTAAAQPSATVPRQSLPCSSKPQPSAFSVSIPLDTVAIHTERSTPNACAKVPLFSRGNPASGRFNLRRVSSHHFVQLATEPVRTGPTLYAIFQDH